ncbi:MAG: hypothetical protein HYU86_08535 [Chloroflexi bacterium]|nr:hypothetical protein [Chloroflexota bacterium]
MSAEERWTTWFSEEDRAEMRLVGEGNTILDFSVQYLAQIERQWYPIVRFDTAHGRAHMDISRPDGTQETVPLPSEAGYADVFDMAVEDIHRRWQFYRERYLRWRG